MVPQVSGSTVSLCVSVRAVHYAATYKPMKSEGAEALNVRLSTCLCLQSVRTSHDSQLRHNTHRQVRGPGESGSPDCGARPRWANITLSPIYVCRARALIHCLSVSLLVSLHSLFLTVPNTESLFVIQRRKCNRSQICHAFCLISSRLCSYGPKSCAWPQTASAWHLGTSGGQTRWISWCPGSLTSSVAQCDI